MANKKLRESVLNSWRVMKDALTGFVTATQYALENDFGKRCSERFIRKQMQPHDDIRYLNVVALYKLWLGSVITSGNLRGLELILNDVEIFVRDAKDYAKGLRTEFPSVTESERNHLWNRIYTDLRILQST